MFPFSMTLREVTLAFTLAAQLRGLSPNRAILLRSRVAFIMHTNYNELSLDKYVLVTPHTVVASISCGKLKKKNL